MKPENAALKTVNNTNGVTYAMPESLKFIGGSEVETRVMMVYLLSAISGTVLTIFLMFLGCAIKSIVCKSCKKKKREKMNVSDDSEV